MAKKFKVRNVKRVPPIEFELEDEEGVSVGEFRATGAPPPDVVAAVFGVMPDARTGARIVNSGILINSLDRLVLDRIWVDGDGDEPGRWEQIDDRRRLRDLMESDEVQIPIESIAEAVMFIVESGTRFPTGAPK